MTALITGASAGIGRELALLFARDGYDVALVARRESALDELAREVSALGGSARTHAADLSVPGSAESLHERLAADGIVVDVLVNNAGFGMQGRFDLLPLDRQLAMIQLNVASLTALTRLLLPGMLARDRGGVLNVASTAAFQPGPLMAVYYATKAYVLSFTEAVAEEVAGSRVTVSCLAPGPTDTEFAGKANLTTSRLFRGGGAMSAAAVAQAGYEGWKDGKRLVVPGRRNRLGAFGVKFVPRGLATKVTKRLNSTS